MSERIVLAGLLGLALAACTDEPAPAETSAADADAQGEVQDGTISDAMLPLEEIRSKSPPLAREGGGDGSEDDTNTDAGASENDGGTTSDAAPEAESSADTADETAE